MEHTYRFFILRYAPDRDRGEQVNIGIVVDRSPLDIRLTRDLRKAVAIDARRDAAQILDLEAQVREWTRGIENFGEVHEALRHFGPITVSEVGWFKAADAAYQSNVERIMAELVIAPARPPARLRGRLNTAIRHLFVKHDLLSADPDDIRRNKVVPNYPVSVKERLFADFAYKNGALHFTETVDFRVSEAQLRTPKFNEVGLKSLIAVRSKKLYRGARVYFVYAASARHEPAIAAHLALMDSYSDGIFNFSSTQDRAAYLQHSLSAISHESLTLKFAGAPAAAQRQLEHQK